MKKSISLSIPKPCHENWKNFSPTSQGGFCSSCQKEVIDFTTWSDDDIKNYFKNHTQSTCGKFQPGQLKSYSLIEPRQSPLYKWFPLSMLGFTLLLARPTKAQQSVARARSSTPVVITVGLIEQKTITPKDPLFPTKINGIVIDSHQMPIPGAIVTLKGTSISVITDAEGCFNLDRPSPAFFDTLVVSFIGYEQQQIRIEGKSDVTIELIEDISGEVVMVGGVVSYRKWSLRSMWWRFKNVFR